MEHSQKSHSSAGSHNMTVMLFTLLGVFLFLVFPARRADGVIALDHHPRRLTFRIVCRQSFTRSTDQGCIHDFTDAMDKRLTLTSKARTKDFRVARRFPKTASLRSDKAGERSQRRSDDLSRVSRR